MTCHMTTAYGDRAMEDSQLEINARKTLVILRYGCRPIDGMT